MQQARVLLVEPDALQQLGMRSALGASGFRCIGAETAEAAVSLLREPYDLVFIGPSVADSECAAIAAAIRAAWTKPAAIVALTALPDTMIGRELAGAGSSPDLPAALEALTRYLRFAPAGPPRDPAGMERLVGDWARFDGMAEE